MLRPNFEDLLIELGHMLDHVLRISEESLEEEKDSGLSRRKIE